MEHLSAGDFPSGRVEAAGADGVRTLMSDNSKFWLFKLHLKMKFYHFLS